MEMWKRKDEALNVEVISKDGFWARWYQWLDPWHKIEHDERIMFSWGTWRRWRRYYRASIQQVMRIFSEVVHSTSIREPVFGIGRRRTRSHHSVHRGGCLTYLTATRPDIVSVLARFMYYASKTPQLQKGVSREQSTLAWSSKNVPTIICLVLQIAIKDV